MPTWAMSEPTCAHRRTSTPPWCFFRGDGHALAAQEVATKRHHLKVLVWCRLARAKSRDCKLSFGNSSGTYSFGSMCAGSYTRTLVQRGPAAAISCML